MIFLLPSAFALTLQLESESIPYSGVSIQHFRVSNPNTDVTVVFVDLCSSGIHIDATHIDDAYSSVGSWANTVEAQIAINGDFYRTSPIRVYGDAVGNGIPWPTINSGLDTSYSEEWYHQKFGWIAFGHDWVEYTYTKWVKNHPNHFSTSVGGWAPNSISPTRPSGTIALVSGFPTLVMEGEVYTCTSPSDSSCFPDRSDMRERHPRSAIGLTADRQTLILVSVDGRSTSNAGMYGSELSELMGQLGAHFALNLDGGGSSQLWSSGYLNSPSETYRSVANHLGVFAGEDSVKPLRPGHCQSEPSCQTIPPEGDIIDNTSDCFALWGPPAYWRTENSGYNGELHWTNAFQNDVGSNWAWWQFDFEDSGEYKVEYYGTPEFSVHNNVAHIIVADDQEFNINVDQSNASGWTNLGTYTFAEGKRQFVALYDNNTGNVSSNQHIVADAVRLTRMGEWCGDDICNSNEDCQSCPEDCAESEEIPNNGIDDDCDGVIDLACDENETTAWCIDAFNLATCELGTYSEISCTDSEQVCSVTLLSCVDVECLDRENESWCSNEHLQICNDGLMSEVTCLENQQCTDEGCVDDDSDSQSPNTSSDSSKSSCAGGGIGAFFFIVGWRSRQRF